MNLKTEVVFCFSLFILFTDALIIKELKMMVYKNELDIFIYLKVESSDIAKHLCNPYIYNSIAKPAIPFIIAKTNIAFLN